LNGGSDSAVYHSTGRSWSSSALSNGSYAYHVYACNAAGCSARSNGVAVTVLHVPAAPASVTAPRTVKRGVAFGVSWSSVTTATRYELRQTLTDTGAVTTPYSGSGTGTVITLYTPPDGIFRYAARACNSAGCSGWTNAPNTTWLSNPVDPQSDPASGSSSP
jgi:hypothetical protein